jgi:hypothetical protein
MILVVSFGSDGWEGSLEALRHSALRNGADEFRAYGPSDVPSELLDPGVRGYGHSGTKPWIIADALERVDIGDVVVWCDADMVIEKSLRPLSIDVAAVLLPRLGGWETNDNTIEKLTKPAVLEALDPTGATWGAVQVNAAFQVYRAGDVARGFVSEYLALCSRKDIIDDSGDLGPATDHGHDQSVLSVLAAKASFVELTRDVTQYGTKDPKPVDHDGAVEFDHGTIVHHHGRKLSIPRIAVVTATIGGPYLAECLKSVQASTLPGIEHFVVVDGPEHAEAVFDIVRGAVGTGHASSAKIPIVSMTLPHNVGAGGWCGHR